MLNQSTLLGDFVGDDELAIPEISDGQIVGRAITQRIRDLCFER